MKESNWLSKELNRDSVEVENNKKDLIKKIKSLDKDIISNTVVTDNQKKEFGFVWRLRKVLGI